MKPFNIGMIGAGHISQKLARTLAQVPDVRVLAVGSRSLDKAQAFAAEMGVERAYGSYAELIADPDVQLVYVATPHSHHFEPTRQALLAGKPCLVEKAFTMNAEEAEELIRIARERNVFLTEAMLTRFKPFSRLIRQVMESGIIGQPQMLSASLCYKVDHKERVVRPELGGGALLDLGVYVLNFARMYFGSDVTRMVSNALVGPTGVDLQEHISLTFADGKMANLQCGIISRCDRHGVISGSEGHLIIDNVNNPMRMDVYVGFDHHETYKVGTAEISGYEHEVLEAKRCIEAGLVESPLMPHSEMLAIMQQLDVLRKEWGVAVK